MAKVVLDEFLLHKVNNLLIRFTCSHIVFSEL